MTLKQVLKDIRSLKIQGAQNVAIAAVNALLERSKKTKALTKKAFLMDLNKTKTSLESTRPTEPCMRNALKYVVYGLEDNDISNVLQLKKQVKENAKYALTHLKSSRDVIAHYGQGLIKKGKVIYTHCHSSTVTSLIKEAHFQGRKIAVHNTETRPLWQGRKTAKEIATAGVPIMHYVDSAGLLAIESADIVLFGADAITSSFIYNKIGTELFCEIAEKYRKPIYFCTDSWKFDSSPHFGQREKIEQRPATEVWSNAPKKVKIFNPAFEEIPAKYATGIISELGIFSHKTFIKKVKKAYPWI